MQRSLFLEEKMKDEPGSRLEDGQDDGKKTLLMVRGRGKGEQGTKVAPIEDEGGHTGPPLQ
jgi:hypothetical protein